MTTLVYDDFNRADSTVIGPSVGGNITPVESGGDFSISSNKLVTSARGTLSWETGTADAAVEITLVSGSNTSACALRVTDVNNCWFFYAPGGVYKRVAGSSTKVLTTPSYTSGVLRFEVVGNVFTAYHDDVAVGSYTDSGGTFAGVTTHGVYIAGATSLGVDAVTIEPAGALPTAHGTATLAATAAFTGTGRKVARGAASTIATSTLTSSGRKTGHGTTLLTSPAGLTASGHPVGAAHGTAILTLTSVLTAVGHKNGRGTTALSLPVTLTTSGHRAAHGTALLISPATLTASGHAVEARHGLTTLTLTPSLTAGGQKVAHGTTALALTTTLTARGDNPANRHDVTVTASLEPRRWAAVLSGRDKAGTLSDRRWTGALL